MILLAVQMGSFLTGHLIFHGELRTSFHPTTMFRIVRKRLIFLRESCETLSMTAKYKRLVGSEDRGFSLRPLIGELYEPLPSAQWSGLPFPR